MDLKKSLYTRLGKSSEHLTFASSSDDEASIVPKKKTTRLKKCEKQDSNTENGRTVDSTTVEVEKKRGAYGVFAKWKNAYVRFNDKSDEENEKLNQKSVEKPKNNYFRFGKHSGTKSNASDLSETFDVNKKVSYKRFGR